MLLVSTRVGYALGDMPVCGGGRAGRGAGGMVISGRGPKVRQSLGVGRGREGRRERGDRKGWEAWGRAVVGVGKARGSARMRTGREGGEGRELWGTILIHMSRDTGSLGHTARVGGRHGDGLVTVRAEGEVLRSADNPIEDAKGVRDSKP